VMNGAIDACEAVEKLEADLSAGEYGARSDYQEDVCVVGFLHRFWAYPNAPPATSSASARGSAPIRSTPPEIARALINAAVACSEAIGLSDETLSAGFADFEAHCGSGGHSVGGLLRGISQIQNGWMTMGIAKALAEFRGNKGASPDDAKA
jgi:hypothetical protein